MKRKVKLFGWTFITVGILAGFAWAVGPGILAPAQAQDFRIDWYRISPGHGTHTNTQYHLTGTVGQPDAHGVLQGGSYLLTGGFWSVVSVVATPGAPELTIRVNSPQTALVSWDGSAVGFLLQQNSTLNAATWVEVPNPVTTTPVAKEVEIRFTPGNTFYRLMRR